MNHCLIYEDSSGFCKIVVPRGWKWHSRASEEEEIQRLHAWAIPNCLEFFACKLENLPTDRTFRDAWKKGTVSEPILIDLEKAKEIHRRRLKEACDLKIDQLTKEMAQAFERSNLPEAVAIGRTTQILRTLHLTDLSHCKCAEDVKYSIPRELFDVWSFYSPKRV